MYCPAISTLGVHVPHVLEIGVFWSVVSVRAASAPYVSLGSCTKGIVWSGCNCHSVPDVPLQNPDVKESTVAGKKGGLWNTYDNTFER